MHSRPRIEVWLLFLNVTRGSVTLTLAHWKILRCVYQYGQENQKKSFANLKRVVRDVDLLVPLRCGLYGELKASFI